MGKLKLSAPWTTLYREINALFEKDPDVTVFYDEDNAEIKLFVDDEIKAMSLDTILPTHKTYGNIQVKITVVPPNHLKATSFLSNDDLKEKFEQAFKDNPVFSKATAINTVFSDYMLFVEFAPIVIQFYNDEMSSLYGLKTTLFHDIAKDIFELNGVFYNISKIEE